MKKKRFIKLMRAAGYSPHIIRLTVDAIKSCGGRIDYATVNRSLKRIYRMKERED